MENKLKLEVGTILFTKDGREIGNAIVTDVEMTSTGERFLIKTDYGSVAMLSQKELGDLFHFDFETYEGADLLIRRESHKFIRTLINA